MPHLRCRRPRRSQIHLGLVVLYILWNEKVVSENSGTPKSSILIGFSIINHPIWGTPIFGNTQKSSRINMCQHALSFGPSLPSPPHAAFPSSSGCPESGFVSVCIFWPLLLGIAWDVWKEATTWIYNIYINIHIIWSHIDSFLLTCFFQGLNYPAISRESSAPPKPSADKGALSRFNSWYSWLFGWFWNLCLENHWPKSATNKNNNWEMAWYGCLGRWLFFWGECQSSNGSWFWPFPTSSTELGWHTLNLLVLFKEVTSVWRIKHIQIKVDSWGNDGRICQVLGGHSPDCSVFQRWACNRCCLKIHHKWWRWRKS